MPDPSPMTQQIRCRIVSRARCAILTFVFLVVAAPAIGAQSRDSIPRELVLALLGVQSRMAGAELLAGGRRRHRFPPKCSRPMCACWAVSRATSRVPRSSWCRPARTRRDGSCGNAWKRRGGSDLLSLRDLSNPTRGFVDHRFSDDTPDGWCRGEQSVMTSSAPPRPRFGDDDRVSHALGDGWDVRGAGALRHVGGRSAHSSSRGTGRVRDGGEWVWRGWPRMVAARDTARARFDGRCHPAPLHRPTGGGQVERRRSLGRGPAPGCSCCASRMGRRSGRRSSAWCRGTKKGGTTSS
jgi:hypothetical protein